MYRAQDKIYDSKFTTEITKTSLSAAFRRQQINDSMELLQASRLNDGLPLNSAKKSNSAPQHIKKAVDAPSKT